MWIRDGKIRIRAEKTSDPGLTARIRNTEEDNTFRSSLKYGLQAESSILWAGSFLPSVPSVTSTKSLSPEPTENHVNYSFDIHQQIVTGTLIFWGKIDKKIQYRYVSRTPCILGQRGQKISMPTDRIHSGKHK
jgi:hypothetical protein